MVKTIAILEHRQTSATVTVEIISKEPLRPYQLRESLDKELGNRWHYRTLDLSCVEV
ncbi:MAG: hypothetical protein VKL42_04960 [Snowella sp.]|nr:hypothetical protein [Snowella sp.]